MLLKGGFGKDTGHCTECPYSRQGLRPGNSRLQAGRFPQGSFFPRGRAAYLSSCLPSLHPSPLPPSFSCPGLESILEPEHGTVWALKGATRDLGRAATWVDSQLHPTRSCCGGSFGNASLKAALVGLVKRASSFLRPNIWVSLNCLGAFHPRTKERPGCITWSAVRILRVHVTDGGIQVSGGRVTHVHTPHPS